MEKREVIDKIIGIFSLGLGFGAIIYCCVVVVLIFLFGGVILVESNKYIIITEIIFFFVGLISFIYTAIRWA